LRESTTTTTTAAAAEYDDANFLASRAKKSRKIFSVSQTPVILLNMIDEYVHTHLTISLYSVIAFENF
jgi:hypothetical protein